MRDANGNELAGKALKDTFGHPIVPVGLSPQEPGTVEALRAARVENAELRKEITGLQAELAALKTEHDATLMDIGILSDSHAELQIKHEKLLETHIETLQQVAAEDEKPAPANLVVMPPPVVEAEADSTPEGYGTPAVAGSAPVIEPFPLESA